MLAPCHCRISGYLPIPAWLSSAYAILVLVDFAASFTVGLLPARKQPGYCPVVESPAVLRHVLGSFRKECSWTHRQSLQYAICCWWLSR